MKELDVLLNRWLDIHAESATPEQLSTYEKLLECEDDALWQWMLGRAEPPEPLKVLVEQIRTIAHV